MVRTRLTSKGQVTIPKDVRELLGLRIGDEIEFVEDERGFHLRKCLAESPFHKWRGHLQHLAGRTTDDVMDELRAE